VVGEKLVGRGPCCERIKTYPVEDRRRREVGCDVANAYRTLERVCGIYAWGSTAVGDSDAHSDVDIAVYSSDSIPSEADRALNLRGLADDPASVSFGRLRDLEGYDKFHVRSIAVFVGWWLLEQQEAFVEEELSSLLDRLDDALAENDLAELQRALVLWDPDGHVARLQGIVRDWFGTPKKKALIDQRMARAEFEVAQHLPRALARGDAVWAEEARRSALNEMIRVVYYLNNRFLRRLKSVDTEIETFGIAPANLTRRVRKIAISDPGTALPQLQDLLTDLESLV
jgi:predicted nucleotidyltransferase